MVTVIGLNLEVYEHLWEVNNEFLLNGPETQFPKIIEVANINSDKQQFYQGRKKR